jgi:ribosomal protein S18 acetylase RimI-like enzyme
MRRSRALLGGLAVAGLAAALYRRLGFRPRERAEVEFEDGSAISLGGSPDVDELAAHARAALSAVRAPT